MFPSSFKLSERLVFALVAGLAFLYIILRAAYVPIIHDEAGTYYRYIVPGEFIPGYAHWDAGNHVLNTGLGLLFTRLFGDSLFTLRLANVLAYLLWSSAVWMIGTQFKNRLPKWSVFLALLLCPFVLDFFSLFRGYGMGLAFFLSGIAAALEFVRSGSKRWFLLLMISSGAAIWSVLTLAPAMFLLIVLAALLGRSYLTDAISGWRIIVLLFAVVMWLLAAWYAMELNEIGALYYGSTEGFYSVTLRPLVELVFGDADWIFLVLSVVVVALLLAQVWKRRKPVNGALFLMTGMLVLMTALSILQAELMQINYPSDRTAMQFVVCFILLVGFVVDSSLHGNRIIMGASLLLLFLPIRTILNLNVDRTMYWPYQAISSGVFDRARAVQVNLGRDCSIGVYHQQLMPWTYVFEHTDDQLPLPVANDYPDMPTDLLLIDPRVNTPSSYQVIQEGDVRLAQRTGIGVRTVLLDTVFDIPQTNQEFIDMRLPPFEHMANGVLEFWLSGSFVGGEASHCIWNLTAHVGDEQVDYQERLLPELEGRSASALLMMDLRASNIDKLKSYLYNPSLSTISGESVELKVIRISDREEGSTLQH